MDKIIKPFGFTRIEWQLLTCLSINPQNITQKKLNQLVDNDVAFITRALDKLEEKKLIERHINPQDKRQRFITLTKKGQSIANKLYAQSMKLNDICIKGFSKKELKVLENLTQRIENNIENYEVVNDE